MLYALQRGAGGVHTAAVLVLTTSSHVSASQQLPSACQEVGRLLEMMGLCLRLLQAVAPRHQSN